MAMGFKKILTFAVPIAFLLLGASYVFTLGAEWIKWSSVVAFVGLALLLWMKKGR